MRPKNFFSILFVAVLIFIFLFICSNQVLAICTPHLIFGKVLNSDGLPPNQATLETHAYISTRPNETLDISSAGCGYDIFTEGWLWFEIGNYPSSWSQNESLRIIAIDLQRNESGAIDYVLDSSGSQLISDMHLLPGDHVGPIASNALADGNSPASIKTNSFTLTALIEDTLCGNNNIQRAEYFVDIDPGFASGKAMNPEDGFNSPEEKVTAFVDTSLWKEGLHTVYVRGQDSAANWGTAHSVMVEVTPMGVANIVLFAANSVWLEAGSNILSGDVIVNNISSGPVLDSNVELSIGIGASTPAGYDLKANRITVKLGANVKSDVYYNKLNNKGTITGTLNTPLALPVLSTLPPFEIAPAGTQNIIVGTNKLVSLNEGSYGDIVVQTGGKILFTGGIYNVRSINAGIGSQLLFAAPCEIRVEKKIDTDLNVYVGPNKGSNIDASGIIFYVAGINGNTGLLQAIPKAAQIGLGNSISANFYVPKGTLWIGGGTKATGAFWGKDMIVGIGAQLTLGSYFESGK